MNKERDILECGKKYISSAANDYLKTSRKLIKEVEEIEAYLNDGHDVTPLDVSHYVKATRRLERLNETTPYATLADSLFVSIFSTFDEFIGNLLYEAYSAKGEYGSEKQLSASDVFKYRSIDDLKKHILKEDIDDFRRDSYVKQFSSLEKRLKISLTKYDNWPTFVEASQRRNLITHCGGEVSKQYISICKDNGYQLQKELKVGDKLLIDANYFVSCSELVMETGFKLGQVLWRKLFPDLINDADGYLHHILFDTLHLESWDRAIMIGEFACSLKNIKTDENRKLIIINYAIALAFGGMQDKADSILDSIDWSGSYDDFKLAVSIIKKDYDLAVIYMKEIGKEGKYVSEDNYYFWPLFSKFSKDQKFVTAFEEIYGHPYSTTVHKVITRSEETKREEKGGKGR